LRRGRSQFLVRDGTLSMLRKGHDVEVSGKEHQILKT